LVVFTIEYGLRIWTAVEMPFLARMQRGGRACISPRAAT